jgi:glycosyltransferase involved in cell wall biosynthesis
MAAGRPIIFIGDPDGEAARVIRDAGCGVTIEINASRELASAIHRLQSEPETRDAMGSRGREFFVSRFARDIAIGKWKSLVLCAGGPDVARSAAHRKRF